MNSILEKSKFVTISTLADSPEWRAVRNFAIYTDTCHSCYSSTQVYSDLEQITKSDLIGREVPVGSVEFVRQWALFFNITMPEPIDYPQELTPFYGRAITKQPLGDCSGKFVKPIETKLFEARRMLMSTAGVLEEIEKLSDVGVPSQTLVWASDIVRFTSEFRVYVLDNSILGVAQYDDGETRYLNNMELERVQTMVENYAAAAPVAYALDVGFDEADNLLVVEVNDAWATGYYPWVSMSAKSYTTWLAARWRQILEQSKK